MLKPTKICSTGQDEIYVGARTSTGSATDWDLYPATFWININKIHSSRYKSYNLE